jgi:hypothetical protein
LDGGSARRKAATYTQNNTNTNAYIDIHASSGIGTHDTSVRADEDGLCLRPRGRCDRQVIIMKIITVTGGPEPGIVLITLAQ